MESASYRRMPLLYKYHLYSTLLLLLLAVPTLSQTRPNNWYVHYEKAETERGQISELKDKRRVYVFVSVMGSSTDAIDYQRNRLAQQVSQEIETYGGLEIVKSPEEAEFAINIVASTIGAQAITNPDAEKTVDIKFLVLTRGAQRSDGTNVGRILRLVSKTDRGDSTLIVRQETSAFIKELKKVKGEK
jgi:hypothetical protein